MTDRPLIILRPSRDVTREALSALQREMQEAAGEAARILAIPAEVEVLTLMDGAISLSRPEARIWLGVPPMKDEYFDMAASHGLRAASEPKVRWWWPFKPRPVIVDFSHIVCKPGDVVCIALPADLSDKVLEHVRKQADAFQEEYAVKLHVFADGIQIIGATE